LPPTVRAIDKGVWADAPELEAELGELVRSDPEGARRRAEAAWSGGDLATFLAAAGLLEQAGLSHPRDGARLAEALLEGGWCAEAVELLRKGRNLESPKSWLLLARALAGCGASEEARGAVRQALELDPALKGARELEDALGEAEKGVSLAGWEQARGRIDACLSLRRADQAAETVRALAGTGIPLAREELGALYRLCCSFARELGPDRAGRLPGWLEPLTPHDLRPILAGEGGEPRPEAAEMALRRLMAIVLDLRGGREPAINELGRLSFVDGKDDLVRYELARLVGQSVLGEARLAYAPPAPTRRVFDLFPFNGEFDMLQIKLRTMGDWVERFILVESTLTFRGVPKPVHCLEQAERFAGHEDKVIRVVVEGFPSFIAHPWAREFYQRDRAVIGGSGLWAPNDLVLASDVDEVLDRPVIEALPSAYARLGLRTHRFFLNCRRAEGSREPAKVAVLPAKDLRHHGLSFARNGLHRYRKARVDDAGWHFTSIGDGPQIVAKFNDCSHRENWNRRADDMARRLQGMRDGELPKGWERCGLAELPACIAQSPELGRFLL
jgi:hypothetical protein